MRPVTRDESGFTHVSTGELPAGDRVRIAVAEAYERYRSQVGGEVSRVYPALQRVSRDLFGICVAGVEGDVHALGDADVELSIMSVAKPFVFALVCGALGPEAVRDRVGVNATGQPFNALAPVEQGRDGATNPMVNAGAIATTSLASGRDRDAQWAFVQEGLARFAGRPLEIDEEVYASASATNHRNRAIANLLESCGRLFSDPVDALDLYTRQSCLRVTTRDLAVMGATLADGGVNPVTGVRVVDAESCRCALAVMTTAGLYETSGDWLYDVGLPGKSGIGGAMVTVSPGKGALATFAPPLDGFGNSVKGQLVARFLARRLGLDLFVSAPARPVVDQGSTG